MSNSLPILVSRNISKASFIKLLTCRCITPKVRANIIIRGLLTKIAEQNLFLHKLETLKLTGNNKISCKKL